MRINTLACVSMLKHHSKLKTPTINSIPYRDPNPFPILCEGNTLKPLTEWFGNADFVPVV